MFCLVEGRCTTRMLIVKWKSEFWTALDCISFQEKEEEKDASEEVGSLKLVRTAWLSFEVSWWSSAEASQ